MDETQMPFHSAIDLVIDSQFPEEDEQATPKAKGEAVQKLLKATQAGWENLAAAWTPDAVQGSSKDTEKKARLHQSSLLGHLKKSTMPTKEERLVINHMKQHGFPSSAQSLAPEPTVVSSSQSQVVRSSSPILEEPDSVFSSDISGDEDIPSPGQVAQPLARKWVFQP
jgi:hypothetical protein